MLPSASIGNQQTPSFLRIWSQLKFNNSPKERAFGRVHAIALLLYGREQGVIPMDFKSDMTRQDSLLQKSLCLSDHNRLSTAPSGLRVAILPLNRVTSVFWGRLLIEKTTSYSSFSSCLVFRFSPIVLTLLTSRIIINWPDLVDHRGSTVMSYQIKLKIV